MTAPTVRIVLDVNLTRRYGTTAEVIEDLTAQAHRSSSAHAAVVRLGDSAVRVGGFGLAAAIASALYGGPATVDIHVSGAAPGGIQTAQAVQRHMRQYAAANNATG